MEVKYRMTAILILSIALCSVCQCCEVDDVAVYKVNFHLLGHGRSPNGSGDTAQWSQVLGFYNGIGWECSNHLRFTRSYNWNRTSQGQSHNMSYNLYRIGEATRPLVNDFLQFGVLNRLMEESEDEPRVYDQFLSPEFNEDQEFTAGVVFVDGGHSLVSLISRLISSSNWFIGVDSLDLCVRSSWIDEVTLDLEPMSAGFGFNEQENRPVEKLSHLNTEFDGAGLYSRRPKQVHPIAKVEFVKVKEYSTKELNELVRKELISEMKSKKDGKSRRKVQKKYNIHEEYYTKNPFDQLKDLEEDPVGTPRPNDPDNNVIVVTEAPTFDDASSGSALRNMDEVVLAVAHGRKLGLGRHLPRHFRSRLHHAVNKQRGKNCIVSEWGSWSSCSNRCDEQTRVRTIVQKPRHGGNACPELTEKRPCGHCVRGDGDYIW